MIVIWKQDSGIRCINIPYMGKLCGVKWNGKRPDLIVRNQSEVNKALNVEYYTTEQVAKFEHCVLMPALSEGGIVISVPEDDGYLEPFWLTPHEFVKRTKSEFIITRV